MSLMGILDRVADKATFDKAIGPAQRAVQAVLKPQALKDLLHGTWLGHPLHPVLVQVPVGSWTSAGLLDAIPPLRPAATVLIGTGVAAAVPAALSGAADWSEQAIGVRRLGLLHAAGNTVALGLYIGSLVARARGRGGLGRVLSYAGLGPAARGVGRAGARHGLPGVPVARLGVRPRERPAAARPGGQPAGQAGDPHAGRPRHGPAARAQPVGPGRRR